MDTSVSAKVMIPAVSATASECLAAAEIAESDAKVAQARARTSAATAFLKEWESTPERRQGRGVVVMGKRIAPVRAKHLEERANDLIAESFSVMELARLCATRRIGLEGYFDGLIAIRDDVKMPWQARLKANEQILKMAYKIRESELRLKKAQAARQGDDPLEDKKPEVEEAKVPIADVTEALSGVQGMLSQEGGDGQ